jgi:hypothetical protein
LVGPNATPASGETTLGTEMRVYVRGINQEDSLASDFVPVAECVDTAANISDNLPPFESDNTNENIEVSADIAGTPAYSVFTGNFGERVTGLIPYTPTPPPWHSRIREIEVWRTQSATSSSFYREATIQIPNPEWGEPIRSGSTEASKMRMTVAPYPGVHNVYLPIRLSDDNVSGLGSNINLISDGGPLNNVEFSSGGLPPVCKDVVSLRGITICLGKADKSPERPVIYSRDYHVLTAKYTTADGRIVADATNPFTTAPWTHYVSNPSGSEGTALDQLNVDELVVVFGGYESSGATFLPERTYRFDKVDGSTDHVQWVDGSRY